MYSIHNFHIIILFPDQLPEEVKKKRIEKAKKMPGNCDMVPEGIICSSKAY